MEEDFDQIIAKLDQKKKNKKHRFSLVFYLLIAALIITTFLSIYSFKKTEKDLGLNDNDTLLIKPNK